MLFILSGFYENAEEADFWPPFIEVEPKVVKVRASGGKDAQYAFILSGFYDIAKEADF